MDGKEKQNSQDLNLPTYKQIPKNNLDTQFTSDQNVEKEPLQSLNAEVSLNDAIEKVSSPKEATVVAEQSISDLNKELSNLSTKNEDSDLPKEIQIVESPKTSISKPISQIIKKPPVNIKTVRNNKANNLSKESKIVRELEKEKPKKTLDDSEEKKTLTKPTKKDPSEKKTPIAIRTYRSDLAEVIKKNKVSLTDVFFAEEAEKRGEGLLKNFPLIKKSSRKKIYLSLLSLFLIFSGITFVFFVYYYKPTPIIKVGNVEVKSFVFSEYQREIFLENLNTIKLTNSIQTELDNINLPIGSLLHFYLTKRYQKENNLVGKGTLKTSELFSLINARASETFLRFIEPDFMYGYYSSSENFPFLILKTRSFNNTFPEMLLWEDTLIEDLRPIFVENKPAISLNDLRSKEFKFKDIIINNKDTRAVLDDSGKIIFIYTFVDKNTIIITTNKIALQEIFDRLTISYRER